MPRRLPYHPTDFRPVTHPSVSVVVPAYNAQAFLEATLASLTAQTHPPREIIVVDDGSVDETPHIAHGAPSPVRLVRKDNGGVSSARNRGLAEARGDFVAFCDADDQWLPEKLETQLQVLRESPGASAAFTGALRVDQGGSLMEEIPGPHLSRVSLTDLVEHREGRIPAVVASSLLVSQSQVEDVGGFDETLSDAADWDYAVRLRLRGPFCGPTAPLVRYRVHTGAMSRNLDLRAADMRRLFDKLEADERIRSEIGSRLPGARARNAVVMAAGFASTGSWLKALRWLLREGAKHPFALAEALASRMRTSP
jgi:glycosyltransferase involved in cell wall biosynthesis